MARVVSLECDRCGLEIKNDSNRISLWPHKVKFTKYDIVCQTVSDADEVYLCGTCAREFKIWMKGEW